MGTFWTCYLAYLFGWGTCNIFLQRFSRLDEKSRRDGAKLVGNQVAIALMKLKAGLSEESLER